MHFPLFLLALVSTQVVICLVNFSDPCPKMPINQTAQLCPSPGTQWHTLSCFFGLHMFSPPQDFEQCFSCHSSSKAPNFGHGTICFLAQDEISFLGNIHSGRIHNCIICSSPHPHSPVATVKILHGGEKSQT